MLLRIALALAAASLAAAQSLDVTLAQLEQRRGRPASASELTALSTGLAADAANPAYKGQTGYAARMRNAARSLAYLNGMRRASGIDLSTGLAMAGASQNIGAMQVAGGDSRYHDRRGAILSYQNSYLLLNDLAGRYPGDPRITGQLGIVAGRVRALGGTLPVWVTMPIGGGEPESPSMGIPEQVIPVEKGKIPTFAMPKLDWAKVPGAQRQTCGESLERYIAAASSAQGALSVMDSIRMSVESRGLSLRADYVAGAARLGHRMNTSREQLERMECEAANETLAMAEGETRRLMKDLGQ
jgi:hypothetical protein